MTESELWNNISITLTRQVALRSTRSRTQYDTWSTLGGGASRSWPWVNDLLLHHHRQHDGDYLLLHSAPHSLPGALLLMPLSNWILRKKIFEIFISRLSILLCYCFLSMPDSHPKQLSKFLLQAPALLTLPKTSHMPPPALPPKPLRSPRLLVGNILVDTTPIRSRFGKFYEISEFALIDMDWHVIRAKRIQKFWRNLNIFKNVRLDGIWSAKFRENFIRIGAKFNENRRKVTSFAESRTKIWKSLTNFYEDFEFGAVRRCVSCVDIENC